MTYSVKTTKPGKECTKLEVLRFDGDPQWNLCSEISLWIPEEDQGDVA